jgi:hypothetical protein
VSDPVLDAALDDDPERPARTEVEALRWAVQSQRALAFNLGYLDLPLFEDEDLPDLTWQVLSELHATEYELLNDFVCRRMAQGEQLTPEWSRPVALNLDDEDE